MRRLDGVQAANALSEQNAAQIAGLLAKGVVPKLAAVRIGDRENDISYEKSVIKKFASLNALAEAVYLSPDAEQDILEETIQSLNKDPAVHGILLFRPLPKHLSEERVKNMIAAEKDVDGMGLVNTAYTFAGSKRGFPPCTPQAVIELMDYYGIDAEGKKAVIIGRSLVVGKPLAMLLLEKNATVTVCHTKTADLANVCRNADILIACAGVARMITSDYINSGQIVIDAGINIKDGKLCGDVDYENVAGQVQAITPVPGGIGSITTMVLLKHTIASAIASVSRPAPTANCP